MTHALRLPPPRRACRGIAGVVALALALAGCSRPDDVPAVTWSQARERLAQGNAILFDVRTPQEATEPMAGAIPVPYVRPGRGGDDKAFAMEVTLHAADRNIILACSIGLRSTWAAHALARQGIESVSVTGGIAARDYDLRGAGSAPSHRRPETSEPLSADGTDR